jgi:hypothetical protein
LKEGLKRVGGFKDGGYLIPSINLEIDGLISPGIGDSFSFEFELVGLTEKVVLIDATVNKPKNLPDNMIHLQKMLAASSSQAGDYISLVDIRTKYFPTAKSLVLQMDIEGSEYFAFKGMQNIFKRSKVLVTEFIPHHLKNVALASVEDFWSTLEPHFKYLYIPGEEKVFKDSKNILRQLRAMFNNDQSYANIVFLKANDL